MFVITSIYIFKLVSNFANLTIVSKKWQNRHIYTYLLWQLYEHFCEPMFENHFTFEFQKYLSRRWILLKEDPSTVQFILRSTIDIQCISHRGERNVGKLWTKIPASLVLGMQFSLESYVTEETFSKNRVGCLHSFS